ncbi:MAG: hypothetical protein R2699_01320 [Acidimicrobiales bacterium]
MTGGDTAPGRAHPPRSTVAPAARLFLSSDNLRKKGAALNAVQIAEGPAGRLRS